MFYPRDWRSTAIVQFIEALDAYIRWYNEKRNKMSFGYLSPIEYRERLGFDNVNQSKKISAPPVNAVGQI